MSEILTNSKSLKHWGDLYHEPNTGEAYREQIVGDDVNGQEMLYIPTGFHFDATTQQLPGDQSDPESPLAGTPIPPWNSLSPSDAIGKARTILLSVLPTGTMIDVETEAGMEHFSVFPLPLGYVIKTPNGTVRRNCGMVARSLMHGIIYDAGTKTVRFDLASGTQAIVQELKNEGV